jgi:MFS family permease
MTSSKRPTLIVTCLATAMLMLDIAVVNTAMAHIGGDLHASLSSLKWVVDAYTLALATTVLTVGSLADRFGDAFRQGGIAVGVAALGALIPSATAHLHDAAYVDGLRTALIVCAAVCAVGAIAGFRLIPGPASERLGAAVPEAA